MSDAAKQDLPLAPGDKVSYQRRQYKITTIWEGSLLGYVSIRGLGIHDAEFTLSCARLRWSDVRLGGCWIVLKAAE